VSLVLLAARNLLRHKRRTLTTLAALVLGLGGLVVFQGFLDQMMVGFRDATIYAGLGHLQVAADESYYTEGTFFPYAHGLTGADALAADLSSRPGVVAVFPSTGFTAVASNGEKSVNLLVKAYPADRLTFGGPAVRGGGTSFRLGPLQAGRGLVPGDRDTLVLGETTARILKAGPGSVVTLMVLLPDGGLGGRDFTVAGVYRSPGLDKTFAYTDYATAQDLTGQTVPPVLHVLTSDPGLAIPLGDALKDRWAVRSWQALAPFYIQVNSMFQGFLGVIRVILLLITLFILANTLNRIVFERMREWGTLRAFGTPKVRIVALVVCEGGFLGLTGALLGTAAGFLAAGVINLAGGIPYTFQETPFQIPIRPDLSSVADNLGPVVLTALVSALWPALRAVRPSPAECLRQP